MAEPKLVRVTLEVEQGSDPLRGRLLVGELSRPFSGWLGLAVELERATGTDHQPVADE